MNLFDVYLLFDIAITKGEGCRIRDEQGNDYLGSVRRACRDQHRAQSPGLYRCHCPASANVGVLFKFRREQVATIPCRTVGTRIGIR